MQGNETVSLAVAEGSGTSENVAFINWAPPVQRWNSYVNDDIAAGAPIYIQLKPSINVFDGLGVTNNKPNVNVIETYGVTNNTQNATVNGTFQEQIENISRLCGYPLFIEEAMCEFEDEVSVCTNSWAAVIFGLIVALLAVTIISVNALIIGLVCTNPTMKTQHHAIKGKPILLQ